LIGAHLEDMSQL